MSTGRYYIHHNPLSQALAAAIMQDQFNYRRQWVVSIQNPTPTVIVEHPTETERASVREMCRVFLAPGDE